MKRFLACLFLFLAFGILPIRTAAGADTPIQQVIREKVSWEGEVTVDGIVIVTGEGSLSIAPGTRILFSPRDDNGDGIGDSELRVEGRLEVAGTEMAPVVFTSRAPSPAPADWKYIMINHAAGAIVRNALIEYAYSGIQVHYTRGSFSGVVSRFNVDGFRFSTAPVTLENSLMTENVHGIRFEERGAGAVIRNNRITRNRIGVFAVIRCQGLTQFVNNAIDDNDDYAVKVGMEQRHDIPMSGNFWGTGPPERIPEAIYDGRIEAGIGMVEYIPYLDELPDTPFFSGKRPGW